MMTALSKWKLALSLAAIFTAGSVTGWMVASKNVRQAALKPPPQKEIAGSWKNCLQSKLNLAPEQSKQVDAILERNSAELHALHDENLKRIRQSLSNRNAQIATVLTPDQQRGFAKIEKDRHDSRGKDSGRNKNRSHAKSDPDRDKSQRTERAKKERVERSNNVVAATNLTIHPSENPAAAAP